MTLAILKKTFELSSHETDLIERFDDLFMETSAHTNLVSRSTLAGRWHRHYADSLQLWPHIPDDALHLLDIGAGAGFPGLPLAILAQTRRPECRFVLVDSVGKKARFLQQAIATLDLTNVVAKAQRAETLSDRYDVITARAVTALPKLLALCAPLLKPDGTLILPKGARATQEVEEANADWRMGVKRVGSTTDPDATILVITEVERRS